jgi:hypothetical protein
VQAAQQQTAQQRGKADISHYGFEQPGYRHCEALFRPVESSDGGLATTKDNGTCNHAPGCQAAYTFCYIFL